MKMMVRRVRGPYAQKLSCTACWKKVSVKRLKVCAGCSAHLCPGCRRDHPEKVCLDFKLLLAPVVVRPVDVWVNA